MGQDDFRGVGRTLLGSEYRPVPWALPCPVREGGGVCVQGLVPSTGPLPSPPIPPPLHFRPLLPLPTTTQNVTGTQDGKENRDAIRQPAARCRNGPVPVQPSGVGVAEQR